MKSIHRYMEQLVDAVGENVGIETETIWIPEENRPRTVIRVWADGYTYVCSTYDQLEDFLEDFVFTNDKYRISCGE